jgi:VanZ family protein
VKPAVRAWLPAVGWAALIFALSSRPTLPVDLHLGRDKIAHFAAYAVLGFFLARARQASGLSAVAAALLGVAYAASDEWHQSFVPGRSAEVADWLADALGVVAGLFLYQRLPGRRASGTPRHGMRTDLRP